MAEMVKNAQGDAIKLFVLVKQKTRTQKYLRFTLDKEKQQNLIILKL